MKHHVRSLTAALPLVPGSGSACGVAHADAADASAPGWPSLIARLAITVCVAAVALGLAAAPQSSPPAPALFVAPNGSDDNPGTADRPVRTLQKALDLAQPGTIVTLAAGVYDSSATRRAGRADAPIVIRGPETGRDPAARFRAVIRGPRIALQINHSYYRLQGFTVDGQPGIPPDRYPNDLAASRAFKDSVASVAANSKLIYIGYAPDSRDITGVVLDDLFLHGAGGECVRLRNNAYGNVVQNTVIRWCGLFPSGDDVARYKYHNGEGVYVGTSPKSTTQPMFENDASHDNVVRDSDIATFGSECFQVKENAHDNRMLRVTCRANEEPLRFGGSNVELRGDHNTVEDSVLSGSLGVNLKIASDEPKYDKGGNALIRNRFLDAAGPHILFKSQHPPGPACGNTFATTRITEKGDAFARAAEPCAVR
jgi:hypothetical protein